MAGEEVRIADKFRHRTCGRLVIELLRRRNLDHPARHHHRNAVDQAQRLLLIVGHKDCGGAGGLENAAYLGAYPHSQTLHPGC